MVIDILGIIASTTSVIGFLPQIYKIKRTKSVQDLSFFMLLNFLLCSLAWMVYGILTPSHYVFITNTAGVCASFVLLSQKIYYQK